MVFMSRQRMKDLLLRARAVVRTSNMKISRRHLADYVKTLHQKACRMCSTIIFLHSTNQIFNLWRCRWRCRRQILNSPLCSTERTLFMWLLISAGFTMSRGNWSFQAMAAILDWQSWPRFHADIDLISDKMNLAALLRISKVRGYDHVCSRWSAKTHANPSYNATKQIQRESLTGADELEHATREWGQSHLQFSKI